LRLTGYSEQDLLARGFAEITHPEDREAEQEQARRLLAGEISSYNMEKRFIRPDGSLVWVSFNASVVRSDNDALYLITQIEDINERKRLEEELRHLAQHDSLTGLFNRRRFQEELSYRLAYSYRYNSPGALFVGDLDKFKETNDTRGHAAGDEALVSTAKVLGAELRRTDISARLGGDEFAVLLPQIDSAEVPRIAQKLVDAVAKEFTAQKVAPPITMSLGVATFNPPADVRPDDLINRADRAMYEAKRCGGSRFCLDVGATTSI
jgi:diguanylate cyclase (GGDEF)-like protein/PAS domain S-box-containing protein